MVSDLTLWKFIASRLKNCESLVLLVVATSSGSSPGRAGYKMAVAADGELAGSIGGGVMEVSLVNKAISQILNFETGSKVIEQIHRKNVPNSSGMICSGKQTVIFKQLTVADADTVNSIAEGLRRQDPIAFEISNLKFEIVENTTDNERRFFSKTSETDFVFQEKLGQENQLYIIGGGHCALALSELMSRLDFNIRIFDDRPELNTIKKNNFAEEVTILGSYEKIGGHIAPDEHTYVVVMTLGYASDTVVIRQLVDRDFRYFGVLGSMAKMATMMKQLRGEGVSEERLGRIHTPIGLPINSQTPEEIAVSIAAQIISIKNKSA